MPLGHISFRAGAGLGERDGPPGVVAGASHGRVLCQGRGTAGGTRGWSAEGGTCWKGNSLIKVHVSRCINAVGHWIIAPVTFGVGRVTEKDARNRPGSEFVRDGGHGATITETPVNAKTIIRWSRTEEELVRSIVPARMTWADVNVEASGWQKHAARTEEARWSGRATCRRSHLECEGRARRDYFAGTCKDK